MQHVITTSDQLQQQLKQIKRRVPPDPSIINLGLNKEVAENIYQCYQHSGKVMKTLQDIVKAAVQSITATGDNDKGLPQDKIKDIANTASDKIYEQDDLGPVQSVKDSLAFVVTQITQLLQFLQDNEYDIAVSGKAEDKVGYFLHSQFPFMFCDSWDVWNIRTLPLGDLSYMYENVSYFPFPNKVIIIIIIYLFSY